MWYYVEDIYIRVRSDVVIESTTYKDFVKKLEPTNVGNTNSYICTYYYNNIIILCTMENGVQVEFPGIHSAQYNIIIYEHI